MTSLEKLLEIMERLRSPTDGCPWDLDQDFASIAPYTVEEAYEVADAIARDDMTDLQKELGDLLFQVVFHAQMAAEAGHFDFNSVTEGINRKLTRRHPHLFGTPEEIAAGHQPHAWEAYKSDERAESNGAGSCMEDIPLALPALMRAQKLGKRAAGVGFDWPNASGARLKMAEELDELDSEISKQDSDGIEDEFGDLLFACVNLARHLNIDGEKALARANKKFERRFRHMEAHLAESGLRLQDLDIEAMERAWQKSKDELDRLDAQ